MFARTVVLQDIRLFSFFAKSPGCFETKRVMHATLQSFRFESNLAEHGGGNFGVNWFAAVRCAGERDLFFSEAEAVSSAGSDQRNCLMRFRRGAQICNRFRCPEECGNSFIRLHRHDMAAMPRLCDPAALYLHQRLGSWYLSVV